MSIPARYTSVAMFFHWAVAILIMINVGLAWSFDLVGENSVRPLIDVHKSIGITVLGLAIMRLLWRFANPPPALPVDYPKWERHLAHTAHVLLYIIIFAMPLSGWMHDSAWKLGVGKPIILYGTIPFPRIGLIGNTDQATRESLHKLFGTMHALFAYVLYGLFVLHVLGALKHQIIDKEPELQRMLPGARGSVAAGD